MIRIHIKNLSAELEFEIGKPVPHADVQQALNRAVRHCDVSLGQSAPLDIPGMSPVFAEGDLQGLFNKVRNFFEAYGSPEIPQVDLAGDGTVARDLVHQDLGVTAAPVDDAPVKKEALEPFKVAPVTFQTRVFNIAFCGSRIFLPVVKAFEFTGFKNAHHLLEGLDDSEQARIRMAADPDGPVRAVSCVSEAGLEKAWDEAVRRMRKRQVKDEELGRMRILFEDLKRIVSDAAVQLQRELLGIPGEANDSMYPSDEEMKTMLNKTELLNTLASTDPRWTRERLNRLLVDQGFLRADALTWGKRDLTKITEASVRNGFIKILPVRGARKDQPGQDAHNAYEQHWKPFFTKSALDYILNGPQGDSPSWGMLRVLSLESPPEGCSAPTPPCASDSDNK